MLRSLLSLSFALWTLFSPALRAAAPAESVVPLSLHAAPLTVHVQPGISKVFRLPANSSFRVDLNQVDADFSLEALDGNRRTLRKVDGFGWANESATFDATPELRFLRVRRPDHEKRAATFVIQLTELKIFSGADLARLHAENLTTSARDLIRDAHGPDSVRGAIAAARGVVEAWHDVGDADAQLRASLLLADALTNSGGFGEALTLYDSSLAASRSLGDLRSTVECLNNRGVALRRQASFAEALDSMNEALRVWKQLPLQGGYAASLNNLALIEFEIADYDSSLLHFSESRQVLRTLEVRDGEAFILNNMALVEGALGYAARSTQYFERAAAEFEAERDYVAAGRALSNSARMYLRTGNAARADANVRRGLTLIGRSGDDRARAESLALWGEVCTATHRSEEALNHLNLALELSRSVHDRRLEANALVGLGRALAQTPRKTEAPALLEDGLALFRKMGTPASQAGAAYRLALVRLDLGQLDQASIAAREAVSTAETIRGNMAAESVRLSFLASIHDYYSTLIDILMRQGRTVEAWQVAERARARALLESIDAGAGSDEEKTLMRRLNSDSLKLTRDSPDAERIRSDVESLTAALSRIRADSAGLDRSPVPGVAEVQQQLGPDTALIEYSINESGGYAWVLSDGSIASFRLPGAATIGAEAGVVADSLRAAHAEPTGNPEFHKAAALLSTMLLQPALTNLHVKRLAIVPDDSVENVPFELLPLPGDPSLIDRYEVVESPSAAVALALKRRRKAHTSAPRGIALVADPVFDSGDSRVGSQPPPLASPARFSRLAFSHREAVALASSVPPNATTLLLGFDASKEAFTSGRLDNDEIINVSTHGIADSNDPARSGLVLSLVDRKGAPRDGLLSANEISTLNLNADIVVLSACDTTIGKQFRGEGVLSTARAFLYAGADRVLGTRWNIDDEASAALLTSFYRSMWKEGLSPPAALRKAQMSVRSDPRWRSPFYWASFVLLGEP